jgi:hypothetical protein
MVSKLNYRFFAIVSLFLLVIILFVLFKKYPSRQNLVNSASRVDSIVGLALQSENKIDGLIDDYYLFANTSDTNGITRVFSELEALSIKEKNAKSYLISLQADQKMRIGEFDSTLILLEEARCLSPDFGDTVNYKIIYNLYGLAYYNLNKTDSAKYYWLYGYNIALKQNSYDGIHLFANNLGTFYYYSSLYGAASQYFLAAYNAVRNNNQKPSAVLLNNIISMYISQNEYNRADSIWNTNLDILTNVDNASTKGLITVNRVILDQKLGRWDKSEELIRSANNSLFDQHIKVEYLFVRINQMLNSKSSGIWSLIWENEDVISDYFLISIKKLKTGLISLIRAKPMDGYRLLNLLNRLEAVNKIALKEDANAMADLYTIKHAIYKSNNQVALALNALEVSLQNQEQYNLVLDSLKRADYIERACVNELHEKVKQAEINIKNERKNQYMIAALWVLTFLGSSILIMYFAVAHRKRNLMLKYAEYRIQKEEEELVFLRNEKQLNSRILTISRLLLEKSQQLNIKLKNATHEDLHDLHKLSKEIESIAKLEDKENPQLADQILKDYDTILMKYPELVNLRTTERRIFALSIEGYKPKDISTTLGISVQHVHNVRTQIRKRISLPSSIDWQELKGSNG